MFLTEAEFTIKCGILLNIGDVMGVQGPFIGKSNGYIVAGIF